MTLIDKGKQFKVAITEVSGSYPISNNMDYRNLLKRERVGTLNPINAFSLSMRHLNTLQDPRNFNYEISNLLLLAYVSRVEDFFRVLIRKLVFTDPLTGDYFSQRELPFAAALAMEDRIMPEAVIEKYNFIDEESILKALKELIGFSGKFPDSLSDIMQDFESIMQLRHCIIHRAGRFGTKNAVKFGFSQYNNAIEFQIRICYNDLQNISEHLDVFVRSINNYIFSYISSRLFAYNKLTGNYSADIELFRSIYNLFVIDQRLFPMHKAYREIKKNR